MNNITKEEYVALYRRYLETAAHLTNVWSLSRDYPEFSAIRNLVYNLKYTLYSTFYTEEEIIEIFYQKDILNIPHDKALQKLEVGDIVISSYGILMKILNITPKGYLKCICFDKKQRRIRPEGLLKIYEQNREFNFD